METVKNRKINYPMADVRQSTTAFKKLEGKTKVAATFDTENQSAADFQNTRWKVIMDSFKKYTE